MHSSIEFCWPQNPGGDEGPPAPGESQLETEWDCSCKSEECKVEKGCSGQCLRGIDHNLHWKSRFKNEQCAEIKVLLHCVSW